ncbi:DUF305 domain-containing protein [Planomonospora parontospora subsp. parontospora]|uniref:DUF305 domain-containing protein n=2 Tax=Planomonospora parontospora TaxID=58119 RepID=A0AA37BB87_9ACTN|nr:DUF305 domain-containing protein [Planomonospora parontospora]GGK45887.1 DUF305 domain-containing protein [Planomonospora parontospora]GII06396.1 DUF305 domain-containing protein [Planomonospora parontospora subsp. parontospora]
MENPVGSTPHPRRRLVVAAALACLVALAVAVLVLGRTGEPTDASAEAGFARDMASHHAQAVEMSFIARDGSSDDALRLLAYDIIVTQTAQRGMFMGWLQQWELGQATERPSMAWMAGHGHGGTAGAPAAMPGMASAAELDRLRKAAGREQEILFLQLMIRHHEGGVQMAEALIRLSDRDEVVTMARHIVNTQDGEIKLMKDMLKQRGAQPLPSIRQ